MKPIIELSIQNVTKQYQTRQKQLVTALDRINFDVYKGEFLCMVGPSGCGKSTLLNLVAGLDEITNGKILLEGKVVQDPSPERVVVFQEGGLFPWLNVVENVEYGLKVKGFSLTNRRRRAMEFLRLVHLERFAQSYIHELSGGMRQRVAIARALVLEPRVLLMDEPFAALDTQTRDLLVEELRGIWSTLKNTVFFVTHNVREAVYLGDRVVLLSYRPGKIKNIFSVNVPRPRDAGDAQCEAIVSSIVQELHEEVEKSVEAEMRALEKGTYEQN